MDKNKKSDIQNRFSQPTIMDAKKVTADICVEFTFCVCRNLYGLIKTEICINTRLISLLDG